MVLKLQQSNFTRTKCNILKEQTITSAWQSSSGSGHLYTQARQYNLIGLRRRPATFGPATEQVTLLREALQRTHSHCRRHNPPFRPCNWTVWWWWPFSYSWLHIYPGYLSRASALFTAEPSLDRRHKISSTQSENDWCKRMCTRIFQVHQHVQLTLEEDGCNAVYIKAWTCLGEAIQQTS